MSQYDPAWPAQTTTEPTPAPTTPPQGWDVPADPYSDPSYPPGQPVAAQAVPNPFEPAPVAPQPEPQQVNQPPTPPSGQPTQDPNFDPVSYLSKPVPEEIIVEWNAPSRPFKQRNRQYYTTIGAIVFLISLILFFAGQFLPIAVVISVAFLAYVLSSVPPSIATHQISNYGIRIEDNLYYWDEMGRFWYTDKFGYRLLNIEIARFPGRVTILLGDLNEEDLTALLSEVLIQSKPADTAFDRAAEWIQKKVPLETGS